jgi:hypothetical protein
MLIKTGTLKKSQKKKKIYMRLIAAINAIRTFVRHHASISSVKYINNACEKDLAEVDKKVNYMRP